MSEARRLLETAIEQQNERIYLAKTITEAWDAQVARHDDTPDETKVSDIDCVRKRQMFRAWQIIGLSRLSLCYSSMAQLAHLKGFQTDADDAQRQAIQAAHDAVLLSPGQQDSSVVAFAHFFYGCALLANGRRKEAIEHFNVRSDPRSNLPGVCTPAIALCKQPSSENRSCEK